MIEELDPLAADPLARRLGQLDLTMPPAPRLTAPVVTARRVSPAWGWRLRLMPVAAAALIAVILTAAVYPGGLLQLTRDALQAAGLSPRQVEPLNGSAANRSMRVSVSGGYADPISTVLFVSVQMTCTMGRPDCGFGVPYLVDQFGERYEIIGGEGIGVGAYPIFFQPLRGHAAVSGARLSLHFPQALSEVVVLLSGTLKPHDAHELVPPAAIVDGQNHVTYRILGLVYSGSHLEVHTRLSGQLDNVIIHYGPDQSGATGEEWPGVFLVDTAGRWSLPVSEGSQPSSVNHEVQDETRIFAVSAPATYSIVVAQTGPHNSPPGPDWRVLARWKVNVA